RGPSGCLHSGGWQSWSPPPTSIGGRCPGLRTVLVLPKDGFGGRADEMMGPAVTMTGGVVGPCGLPGGTAGPPLAPGGVVGPCGWPGGTTGPRVPAGGDVGPVGPEGTVVVAVVVAGDTAVSVRVVGVPSRWEATVTDERV